MNTGKRRLAGALVSLTIGIGLVAGTANARPAYIAVGVPPAVAVAAIAPVAIAPYYYPPLVVSPYYASGYYYPRAYVAAPVVGIDYYGRPYRHVGRGWRYR